MAKVFVSIGSNVEREHHFSLALELLTERFGELQCSNVYESAAVGFDGDPFFNMVVAFNSDAEPRQIVSALHRIERKCGRQRGAKRFSPRTMDLDLLLVGDRVMRDKNIVLPHEEISTQAFVLRPLVELAGECRHPVSGDTLAAMWSRLQSSACSLRKVDFQGCLKVRE